MRKIVVGLIVAFVAYFAVQSIGMPHRFVLLTAVIGFILGFGVAQTFWPK